MIHFSWGPPTCTDGLVLFQRVLLGSCKRGIWKKISSTSWPNPRRTFCGSFHWFLFSWKIPVNLILCQAGSKYSWEFLALSYISQDWMGIELASLLGIFWYDTIFTLHSAYPISDTVFSMCRGRTTVSGRLPGQSTSHFCTVVCSGLSQPASGSGLALSIFIHFC